MNVIDVLMPLINSEDIFSKLYIKQSLNQNSKYQTIS